MLVADVKAESTARIAVSKQARATARNRRAATAGHLLAAEELTKTLARRSRATSPTTASQAVRPLSPQLVFPADSSALPVVRVLQSLENRHRAEAREAEALIGYGSGISSGTRRDRCPLCSAHGQ